MFLQKKLPPKRILYIRRNVIHEHPPCPMQTFAETSNPNLGLIAGVINLTEEDEEEREKFHFIAERFQFRLNVINL